MDKLIEALKAVRETRTDSSRTEVVTRVHLTGRMTARERMAALLDEDSAVEYGIIAGKTQEGDWVADYGR